MSGWNSCGEGFSEIAKYQQVVNAAHQSQKAEKDADLLITVDKTPERKQRIRQKNIAESGQVAEDQSSTTNQSEVIRSRLVVWKEQEFFTEFEGIRDPSSEENEDIQWMSSSDESSPHKGHRKRKQHSPDYHTREPHVCTEEYASRESSSSALAEINTSEVVQRTYSATVTEAMPTDLTQNSSNSSNSVIHSKTYFLSHNLLRPKPQNNGRHMHYDRTFFSFTDNRQEYNNRSRNILCQNSSSRDGNKKSNSCCPPRLKVNRRLECSGNQEDDVHIFVDSGSETDNNEFEKCALSSEDETESLTEISVPSQPVFASQEKYEVGDISSPDKVTQHSLEQAMFSPSQSKASSQVSISSGDCSPCCPKITASDWVTAVQNQTTPVKTGSSWHQEGPDSTKKKRKFDSGSMAEQLTRLLSREKSSIRFWYHSVLSGAQKGHPDEVCPLPGEPESSSQSETETEPQPKALKLGRGKRRGMMESGGASVRSGMRGRGKGERQQLEESSGQITLVCTYFIQVISSDDALTITANEQLISGHATSYSVSAKWNCPCLEDPSLLANVCLATVSPVVPKATFQCVSGRVLQQPPPPVLHAIPGWEAQPTAQTSTAARRTLLESMEETKCGVSCLPPFCASIVRVFRYRWKNTEKIRYEILCEDAAGTLATVMMPEDSANAALGIYRLQGKTCLCYGLQVVSRTNRDKDPALFSIIGSVRTGQFPQTHESHTNRKAANHAYVLQAIPVPGLNSHFEEEKFQDVTDHIPSVEVETVSQTIQPQVSRSRVSFVAKALFVSSCSQSSMLLYVYDGARDTDDCTCVYRLDIETACVVEDVGSPLYLFTDVICENGKLHCDGYSFVIGWRNWQSWEVQDRVKAQTVSHVLSCSLKLPLVCPAAQLGSLVAVEGVIVQVDEGTATTWQECNWCTSDLLTSSEDLGKIYCTGCNRQVDCPVTKMKMEVEIQCRNLTSNFVVRVSLCQKTIESLLPPGQTNDEGYDIDEVIGQQVKCPACLVQSKEENKSSLLLTELGCPS